MNFDMFRISTDKSLPDPSTLFPVEDCALYMKDLPASVRVFHNHVHSLLTMVKDYQQQVNNLIIL